jgi:hypothetical protein
MYDGTFRFSCRESQQRQLWIYEWNIELLGDHSSVGTAELLRIGDFLLTKCVV